MDTGSVHAKLVRRGCGSVWCCHYSYGRDRHVVWRDSEEVCVEALGRKEERVEGVKKVYIAVVESTNGPVRSSTATLWVAAT